MESTPFANLAAGDYFSSSFAFGNNPNNFCCIARNFHPLGWTPSTSSTSSSTSTTTTVVPSTTTSTSSSTSTSTTTTTTTIAPTFLQFTTSNLSQMQGELGITNLNSVAEWNTAFFNHWGSDVGANFTAVQVTGSTIKLSGNVESLTVIPLNFINLTDFSTNSPLPLLEYFDLSQNNLTSFNPSVQITSVSLNTIYLSNNQISVFNPIVSLPDSTNTIDLRSNSLTTFNPTLPLPSNLESLLLSSNLLTVFNTTLPLPDGFKTLFLNSNPITGIDTTDLPFSLSTLTIAGSQLTSFPGPFFFPNVATLALTNSSLLNSFDAIAAIQSNTSLIDLAGCALPSANVNSILARCVALGMTFGILRLNGGTSGAPTGQGITDKNTLITAGVDVVTN